MAASLFGNAPLNLLVSARAAELEAFVEAIEQFQGRGAIFSEMEDEDFERLHAARLLGPIMNTRGSLDILALALLDKVDIEVHLERLHAHDFDSLMKDLNCHGMHGLHFRMGIADPDLRIELTQKLADTLVFSTWRSGLLIGSIDHQPHFPISSLSYTSSGVAEEVHEDYVAWIAHSGSRIETSPYTFAQSQALRDIDTVFHADPALAISAITHLLTEKGHLPWDDLPQQAIQAEKAFLTLVYNRGYRMRVEGCSCEDIATALRPVIQHILGRLEISSGLSAALERQVLVNLFSAFPEGLEMLEARPEELQGLPKNPAVLNDPDALLFIRTLSGPLTLFRANESAPLLYSATQVVSTLMDSGYPVHPDLAAGGFLVRGMPHEDLMLNCHVYSKVIEEQLMCARMSREHPDSCALADELSPRVITHLANPDILQHYHDQVVLKVIELALPVASTSKITSIHQIFMDRPHLVEPTLRIMTDNFYINEKTFAFCHFGMRELRMLGINAPEQMLSNRLESDLGL